MILAVNPVIQCLLAKGDGDESDDRQEFDDRESDDAVEADELSDELEETLSSDEGNDILISLSL